MRLLGNQYIFPDDKPRPEALALAAHYLDQRTKVARRRALDALDNSISRQSYWVLNALMSRSHLQRDIQKKLKLSAGGIQEIKNDLEAKEYITVDRSDRRSGHTLKITDEGRKFFGTRMGLAMSKYEEDLSTLEDDELATLVRLIMKAVSGPPQGTPHAADLHDEVGPNSDRANSSEPVEFQANSEKPSGAHSDVNVSNDDPDQHSIAPTAHELSEVQGAMENVVEESTTFSGERSPEPDTNCDCDPQADEVPFPFDDEDDDDGDEDPLADHEHTIQHQQDLQREQDALPGAVNAWEQPHRSQGGPDCATDDMERLVHHLLDIAATRPTLGAFDGGPKQFGGRQFLRTIRPERYNPYEILTAAEKSGAQIERFFATRNSDSFRHIGFRTALDKVTLSDFAPAWTAFAAEALASVKHLADAGLLRPHALCYQFLVDEGTGMVDMHAHLVADMDERAREDVKSALEIEFIDCWIDQDTVRSPAWTMRYIRQWFSLDNMSTWSGKTLETLYHALHGHRIVHYFGPFASECQK